MSLNYVTLALDLNDGQSNAITGGLAIFTPSVQLTGSPGLGIQSPIEVNLAKTQTVKLLATDNDGVTPEGWGWNVAFSGVSGNPDNFSFFLPFTSGEDQNLSAQAPTSSVTTMAAFMLLPSGTPVANDIPVATGTGTATEWVSVPKITVSTTEPSDPAFGDIWIEVS